MLVTTFTILFILLLILLVSDFKTTLQVKTVGSLKKKPVWTGLVNSPKSSENNTNERIQSKIVITKLRTKVFNFK